MAALRTPTGSGSYTYDLTGTETVRWGDPQSLAISQFPAVYVVDSRVGTEYTDLAQRENTAVFTINAYAAANSTDPLERQKSLYALLSDLELALYADPTLGLDRVMPLETLIETTEGAAVGLATALIGILEVRVRYWTAPGEGL